MEGSVLSAAFLGLPQHPGLLREGHVLETGGFPRVLSQPSCTQTTPGGRDAKGKPSAC